MAYYSIDTGDGQQITTGLSEHVAHRVACRVAHERGETVYLYPETGGEDEVATVAIHPPSCRSCSTYECLAGGEYCQDCQDAVDDGATGAEAYAWPSRAERRALRTDDW